MENKNSGLNFIRKDSDQSLGKKNLMMKDNETLESIVMVELAGQDAQMRQELHRYSLFF